MKKHLLAAVVFLLVALCAQANDPEKVQSVPETWTDESTSTSLMLVRLPKATSAQEVRDQAAGFLEGPIHSGQFLPRAMGNLKFAGLPALFMKGTLYGQEAEQEVLYLLLFSEDYSAIAVAVAARSPDAKSVHVHLGSSIKPLLISTAITEEIGPKIREGVSELQVMARKLIEQKKANQP